MNPNAQHPGKDHPGDSQLLEGIADGDRAALRMLMERYSRRMLSLAERVTGSADDADEVVQEAFVKVWSMAADWQIDGPASFSTWLYRVVLNAAIDRTRRPKWEPMEQAGQIPAPGSDHSEHVLHQQRRLILYAALAEVPERQRKALSLYYFSENTASEAANILDLTPSAVESLLVRAKKALRTALHKRGIRGMEDME